MEKGTSYKSGPIQASGHMRSPRLTKQPSLVTDWEALPLYFIDRTYKGRTAVMAAPPGKTTIKDFNGIWVMNKTLSDSPDPILRAQGIGYLTRKGVNLATVHLSIKQYASVPTTPNSNAAEVTCIETTQTVSGLKGTREIRYLDNGFRDHYDWLFGTVKGQARWANPADVEDATLKEGWLVEGEGDNVVLCHIINQEHGWTAIQIWGFQMIDRERYYCMRVEVISKDGQRAQARFVYNYQSG